MSFDLYLLPANEANRDPDVARDFLDREEEAFSNIPRDLDPEVEAQKRRLVDCFLRLKPSYREFPKDYAGIARFENITEDEARRKWRHIELNGSDEPPEAQVMICDRYVVIHWYSGTPPEEMDAVLTVLSNEENLIVYDPQAHAILDPRNGSIVDGLEP
jgi:hypothetical protein